MDSPDYLDEDEVVVHASFKRLKRARRGYIGGCIESTSTRSPGSSSPSRPTNISAESAQSDDDCSSRASNPDESDCSHDTPSQGEEEDSTHRSMSLGLPMKRRRRSLSPQSTPSTGGHRRKYAPRQLRPRRPTASVPKVATRPSGQSNNTKDEPRRVLPFRDSLITLTASSSTTDTPASPQKPGPQQKLGPQPKPAPQQKPVRQQKPEHQQKPDPQPKPAPQQKLVPQQKPEHQQKPDPKPKSEPRRKPDPQQKSEPQQKPDPQPKPDPQQKPGPQQKPSPQQKPGYYYVPMSKYYNLPIGTLPSMAACRQSHRTFLASIPIREPPNKGGLRNAIHGHFFSQATSYEVTQDGSLEGKVVCRVKVDDGSECGFSVAKASDRLFRQRIQHISSQHSLMLYELYEFRMNQTERLSVARQQQLDTAVLVEDSQAKDATTDDTLTDQAAHGTSRLVPAEKRTPRVDPPPPLTPVSPTPQDRSLTMDAFQDDDADQGYSLAEVEAHESQVEDRRQLLRITLKDTKPKTTSSEQLTRAIANAIAVDSLPMSILDTMLVKSLVSLSNPTAVVPNRRGVESALSLSYMKLSAAAKSALLEADISLGSFAADIWKSRQGKRFLGLTFHYLSSDFEPHTVPLGIKLLEGSLTPRAIRNNIDDVLHDWCLMDKVFCGTADGRSILKSTMKQVCRLQDNGISGIACACYKIQLCINDALEQCKEASAVLKRFNDFLKLLGRESNAEETSGGSQHLQQQRDYFRKSYFWKPPTTYCKSSIEGDDGRLYWCSLYLLVRDHGATLFNDSRERAWSDNVNLHYEEKLNQAQLTQKEAETLEAILPVLEPLFESWALISSGSDSDSDNDNKFGSHEGGGLGRVNQASDISKVYPAIHGIIETVAASTVAHPTAKALGRALVRQLKRHWNLDEIPDAVLMATYLDPATAGSPIFKSTVERNKTRVDLKSHARSLIVQMVQRTLGQPRDYGEAAVTDTDSTHSTSALSKELHAEFVAYYSAVMQDPPETLWDDPRPWWQGHGSDMPHLSSVARSCFSIQATSLPPAQLFDGTQGTEGILADPRGRSNEYTFIRLLTVRNLHRFLHGDGASQLDMADLV